MVTFNEGGVCGGICDRCGCYAIVGDKALRRFVERSPEFATQVSLGVVEDDGLTLHCTTCDDGPGPHTAIIRPAKRRDEKAASGDPA
jgi:hypothetical protein